MHDLKVNNLVIWVYSNITDLLVSLANVRLKLISFSTAEFILASTKFKSCDKALPQCCEQLTAKCC